MDRDISRAWEAAVAVLCAIGVVAGVALAAAMALRLRPAPEPAPYSVCEFCGRVIAEGREACVPEGALERRKEGDQ